MSFDNKVVIVTGSSSGIGAATAKLFAKEKADVVLVGRNVERLKIVSEDIEKITDKEPLTIIADVSKDDEARSIIEKTVNKHSRIDILVNNAGFPSKQLFGSPDFIEDFDTVVATNLRAVVVLTNEAVPHLIKTKGNVVNVSTAGAKGPTSALTAYCTAKAGLDHFSKCIALDLAKKGVRVNVVNPGPVKADAIGLKDQLDAAFDSIAVHTPLGIVSEGNDVAELIMYLASEKTKSITGSTFVIDSGVLLSGVDAMMKKCVFGHE